MLKYTYCIYIRITIVYFRFVNYKPLVHKYNCFTFTNLFKDVRLYRFKFWFDLLLLIYKSLC